MGYKAKVAVMSVIAIALLAAVAFEIYYYFIKEEPKTEEIA